MAAPISSVPTFLWLGSAMSAVRRPSPRILAIGFEAIRELDHIERIAQRHRDAPHRYRVGDTLAGDIRGRAVDGFA